MTSPGPLDQDLKRLRALRSHLLKLHKALLDSERVLYEREHGPIKNSGEFFQLVISHDAFDWLRPISKFIVQIDEYLDPKVESENPVEGAAILLEKARLMLKPAEASSTPLGSHYFQAIQRDPNIALMHAEMSQLLRER
ncbi:MAG: hypothetical protein F6J97_05040 [Leptolyngbya sp. SIO4C1]|nr:hypothetical protein [Leptolyngbya sp. SIO4C1]